MDIFERTERLMGMTDEVWLRHASAWSVWTRVALPLPLLTLALFSRVWIGWWAVVPLALVLVFIWNNPRLFAAPTHFDGWAARGVLGERVWLRKRDTVAAHHHVPARVLTALSGLSGVVWLWGVVVLDPLPAAFGAVCIAVFKLWFVDRMAWVWQDFVQRGGTIDDLGA